jgi:hypothetical protein
VVAFRNATNFLLAHGFTGTIARPDDEVDMTLAGPWTTGRDLTAPAAPSSMGAPVAARAVAAAGQAAAAYGQRVERSERVAAAVHNGEMEGAIVSEATLADLDMYVTGAIDSSELVARTRARYGLT